MREGLEAVFRAEDGERPRAILVGIDDGSGETEQMLDELRCRNGNLDIICGHPVTAKKESL